MSKWKEIARKPNENEPWPERYADVIDAARRRVDAGLSFLARKRDFGAVLLVELIREEPEEDPKPYFYAEREK